MNDNDLVKILEDKLEHPNSPPSIKFIVSMYKTQIENALSRGLTKKQIFNAFKESGIYSGCYKTFCFGIKLIINGQVSINHCKSSQKPTISNESLDDERRKRAQEYIQKNNELNEKKERTMTSEEARVWESVFGKKMIVTKEDIKKDLPRPYHHEATMTDELRKKIIG